MAPVTGGLRRPPLWHFDAARGPSTPSVGGLSRIWRLIIVGERKHEVVSPLRKFSVKRIHEYTPIRRIFISIKMTAKCSLSLGCSTLIAAPASLMIHLP